MDISKLRRANDLNSIKKILLGFINETRRIIENKAKQINLLIQSMKDENELLAAKSKIFLYNIYFYFIVTDFCDSNKINFNINRTIKATNSSNYIQIPNITNTVHTIQTFPIEYRQNKKQNNNYYFTGRSFPKVDKTIFIKDNQKKVCRRLNIFNNNSKSNDNIIYLRNKSSYSSSYNKDRKNLGFENHSVNGEKSRHLFFDENDKNDNYYTSGVLHSNNNLASSKVIFLDLIDRQILDCNKNNKVEKIKNNICRNCHNLNSSNSQMKTISKNQTIKHKTSPKIMNTKSYIKGKINSNKYQICHHHTKSLIFAPKKQQNTNEEKHCSNSKTKNKQKIKQINIVQPENYSKFKRCEVQKSQRNLNKDIFTIDCTKSQINMEKLNKKTEGKNSTKNSNKQTSNNNKDLKIVPKKEIKEIKLSLKESAYFILAKSPILLLKERIIFSRSSINVRNKISIKDVLDNHGEFIKEKIKELEKKIIKCNKILEKPFTATKTAEITLNFITTIVEEDFKNYLLVERGEKEKKIYYSYLHILNLLFDNKNEEIDNDGLKDDLYNFIKNKGYTSIKDFLYNIYISNNSLNKEYIESAIENIEEINEILNNEPDLAMRKSSVRLCKFIPFSLYLVKEIINYAEKYCRTSDLKEKTQNLLDVIIDKFDIYQMKYKNHDYKNKYRKLNNLKNPDD